jgi:acylphosphatase
VLRPVFRFPFHPFHVPFQKTFAQNHQIGLHYPVQHSHQGGETALGHSAGTATQSPEAPASRRCVRVIYSGHVQGVGFRYTVRTVAAGFDVTGSVRNLPDGRVELFAEGAKGEVEAFCQAIRDAGLSGLIRNEEASWSDAQGNFRGFEIVR